MRIYTSLLIHILLVCICSSCSTDKMVELWNSGPDTSIVKEKRKEFYDRESQAARSLREKNKVYCNGLVNSKFSKEEKASFNYVDDIDILYKKCMKDRGTPEYNYSDFRVK